MLDEADFSLGLIDHLDDRTPIAVDYDEWRKYDAVALDEMAGTSVVLCFNWYYIEEGHAKDMPEASFDDLTNEDGQPEIMLESIYPLDSVSIHVDEYF